MKQKNTRNIIGTFSEIGNLIQSSTQLLFDYLKDPEDKFWKWLLLIRKFLRFIRMPSVSESQLLLMQETLDEMMNLRLLLTRIPGVENDKNEKPVPKHEPSVKWKEHFLSHFCYDVRNLGPLILLNTGIIFQRQSKIYIPYFLKYCPRTLSKLAI